MLIVYVYSWFYGYKINRCLYENMQNLFAGENIYGSFLVSVL